ncbi:hypothetical protein AQUCO_00900249v1 [Aquilegia coerulea]|uniref:RRM domain-containing protein n=1 Tax=Aquilegia coerulea TaxID=218851 RepID=A0A2G5ECP2_AQUCA|nr:hypothetical protein AQUCO_00900249v1 [Aquilegia coerulea]
MGSVSSLIPCGIVVVMVIIITITIKTRSRSVGGSAECLIVVGTFGIINENLISFRGLLETEKGIVSDDLGGMRVFIWGYDFIVYFLSLPPLFIFIFLSTLKPSLNPETLLCISTTKMGAKAKKATMRKNLKKKASSLALSAVTARKNESADFLPLEGGPARKLPNQKVQEPLENTATVLYIGRIPHGFYEDEMREFFKQFGAIKHLRIARSRKTGKSKHFGFIEFESPEVAKIVADCMHNYLLLEHMLQVHLIPQEHVHPKLEWIINTHHQTGLKLQESDIIRKGPWKNTGNWWRLS